MRQAKQDNPSPRAEYDRRLQLRKATLARLEERDNIISNLRLLIFAAGIALGIGAWQTTAVHLAFPLICLGAFIALVILHDQAIRAKERAGLAVTYYESLLKRLDNAWPGTGITLDDYVGEDHPYAADLDLFGEGSLFELLCTARTRAGEEALASWLSAPATIPEVTARQSAVEELRENLDLREALALLAGGIRARLQPAILTAWAEATPAFEKGAAFVISVAAWALALAGVAGLVLWVATPVGPVPFFSVLVVQWITYRLLKHRLDEVVETIDQPERELLVLTEILARLEQEPFTSGWLTAFQAQLTAGGRPASAAIRRLDRLVTLLDARRNAFFAPVGFILMWTVHFALRIEAWRREAGGSIATWLKAIGRLEAICALAGYAYDNPDDPFPELVEGGALFTATRMGHPLLPGCVENDVTLGDPTRAWIVSGSNMSGKSTLLRTVGVNALLAMAGAPVRASRLTLSPVSIGATIRVHDSLQAGRSRFYAEIQRLKQLTDLTKSPPPLLFLLDEILHGTNSHDRQIGASALLHQLVKAGAVGLVTTHDLAIADLKEEVHAQVENVHFEDRFESDELVFDYKVLPGVVSGSNAIRLMRSVGLDV